jgi:hypothetical protein
MKRRVLKAFLADEVGASASIAIGDEIPASTPARESLIFLSRNAAPSSHRVQFAYDGGFYEADRALVDTHTEPA